MSGGDRANNHHDITELSDGYDTVIHEDVDSLSFGQKRRVAFAELAGALASA